MPITPSRRWHFASTACSATPSSPSRARAWRATRSSRPASSTTPPSGRSGRASDSSRALYLRGTMTDKGYTFSSRAAAPPLPDRLGDERHMLQLTKLGDGEYEWVTAVDHAVGPVRAERSRRCLRHPLHRLRGTERRGAARGRREPLPAHRAAHAPALHHHHPAHVGAPRRVDVVPPRRRGDTRTRCAPGIRHSPPTWTNT